MVIQRPLLEAQIEESFQKSFYWKKMILGKKYKKTESPKIISKVVKELLIRNYVRFIYFSPTWNLMIAKNTIVNQQKSKQHEKLNFSRKKIQ